VQDGHCGATLVQAAARTSRRARRGAIALVALPRMQVDCREAMLLVSGIRSREGHEQHSLHAQQRRIGGNGARQPLSSCGTVERCHAGEIAPLQWAASMACGCSDPGLILPLAHVSS
jgi:hypothetical protein